MTDAGTLVVDNLRCSDTSITKATTQSFYVEEWIDRVCIFMKIEGIQLLGPFKLFNRRVIFFDIIILFPIFLTSLEI